MADKKETTKENQSKWASKTGKYFYGLGRRKASIAQVRLYKGKGEIIVNELPYANYFSFFEWQNTVSSPLQETNTSDQFDVVVSVQGGGKRGQSEAVRLGVARALLEVNADYRKALKAKGYLSRDPRVKERKKPGLKRARRRPQWSKR